MPKLDDVSTGDYVVPIYMDSTALVDVLASIEGGFSAVEAFRSANTDSSETGFAMGVGGALKLLKISLDASSKGATAQAEETSGQRYHSPGSLLNRLRRHLRDHDLLRRAPPWEPVSASDFVEFRGVFRLNSISQHLTTLKRTLELFSHWGDRKSAKSASGLSPKQILEMIEAMLADLHMGDRFLFVVEAPSFPSIVVPISREFLRDQTFGEITNGEFRVTGKVIRRLADPKEDPIQLFPGSAIAAIPTVMTSFIEAFKFLGEVGMTVPRAEESLIRAPALVVMPIGISV